MDETRITGTLAAAVTPLRDGGERLDEEALAPLLEFYAASGLDGVLMMGTTGEGILLTDAERRRVAELAAASTETLQVVVHCGAQSTAETVALAAHAAGVGADGVAVIGPPYFPFTDDELVEHFVAAARACAPLPFYLYEFADRTGYALPLAVVERVRDAASNVVGMKVSDAPFDQVAPYLGLGLDVFIGAEAHITEGLRQGAVGAVSGVAAAFPEAIAALVREPTAERQALADKLRTALAKRPFQAAMKVALAHRGVPVGPDVRAPLRPLDVEVARELVDELERAAGAGALSAQPTQ